MARHQIFLAYGFNIFWRSNVVKQSTMNYWNSHMNRILNRFRVLLISYRLSLFHDISLCIQQIHQTFFPTVTPSSNAIKRLLMRYILNLAYNMWNGARLLAEKSNHFKRTVDLPVWQPSHHITSQRIKMLMNEHSQLAHQDIHIIFLCSKYYAEKWKM